MEHPADRRYTKEHEWVKLEGKLARVGITDFAQSELGEIVYVEPPVLGRRLKQGDSLCVVESTKAASDVYAPLAGTVSEVNPSLKEQPDLVNHAPLGEGWIAMLSDIDEGALGQLMNGAEYQAYLAEQH